MYYCCTAALKSYPTSLDRVEDPVFKVKTPRDGIGTKINWFLKTPMTTKPHKPSSLKKPNF